jgi:thiamine-monophosphate kinase
MTFVEELGERKIIDIIINCLEKMPNMPIPFGDDVSAVDLGNGKLAVLKTDVLVAKTDVPPGMTLWHAARKAVVMNISDFAAKGVKPLAVMVSLGVPRGLKVKNIEQIGKGLNAGAREYDTYVLGGDTSEALDLIISCALFGIGETQNIMKRTGAQPGDFVAVTGFFGKTTSGLKILLEKLPTSATLKERLVDAVFMPKARLKEGLALAQSNAVTSAIDSSDGLAWSLHEIAKANNVGFLINHVPIAPEVEEFAKMHNFNPIELSLYGGEEYELIVTVKPDMWENARLAVERVNGTLIKIGTVTSQREMLLQIGGKTVPIEAKGWEHLR